MNDIRPPNHDHQIIDQPIDLEVDTYQLSRKAWIDIPVMTLEPL